MLADQGLLNLGDALRLNGLLAVGRVRFRRLSGCCAAVAAGGGAAGAGERKSAARRWVAVRASMASQQRHAKITSARFDLGKKACWFTSS